MLKILILILCTLSLHAEELVLRDNLRRAQTGDYIVTAQGKTYNMLLIAGKNQDTLTIEEITVPSSKGCYVKPSWKTWAESGAPGNTSWVVYNINLNDGGMSQAYSYTRDGYYNIPEGENFLSTLLNLQLQKVPQNERKRLGNAPTQSSAWQPRMVVDGQIIQGVPFDAWKTRWPSDGSELAGKTIEVFVPADSDRYPSYFPYWLQISGFIGKAKVRIIDSGSGIRPQH